MKIDSISIKPYSTCRRCFMRIGGQSFDFIFKDLVEFSQGCGRLLLITERLAATNALHPQDRTFLELESIYVEDAGEYNKRVVSAREVKERRAEGEHIAGGAWYMEININGTSTDCSFNTLAELFQIVQGVIKREMVQNGVIARASGITEMRVAQ